MAYTVHGIMQARMLEWVAFPFSRGIFPTQGSNPSLLHCRQILNQLSCQGSLRHWDIKQGANISQSKDTEIIQPLFSFHCGFILEINEIEFVSCCCVKSVYILILLNWFIVLSKSTILFYFSVHSVIF